MSSAIGFMKRMSRPMPVATMPSFTLWNAGLNYTLKGTSRYSHKLQLNVNNITDEDYLKVNRQLGERRAVYFTYVLGYGGGSR